MLKSLTVSEPFASLIVGGDKWVENRVWAARYHRYGTFGYYEDYSAVVVAETESAALGAVLEVYQQTGAKDWAFEPVCKADAKASAGVWQLGGYERG